MRRVGGRRAGPAGAARGCGIVHTKIKISAGGLLDLELGTQARRLSLLLAHAEETCSRDEGKELHQRDERQAATFAAGPRRR